MINRAHRFRGQKDIITIYRRGASVRRGQITAKFLPSKTANYRLAVVISKKIHKSAVVRNRIRRRLIEQFRLAAGARKTINSDIVLSVYDEKFATAPPKDITGIINQVIEEIEKTAKKNHK